MFLIVGIGIVLIAVGLIPRMRVPGGVNSADLGWMSVGVIAAFVSAFFCVRWLLRYISTHDFTPFAWYRIVFGIVVLWTGYSGLVTWAQ